MWIASENLNGTHDFTDGAAGESMEFTITSSENNLWTNFTWTGRIIGSDDAEVGVFGIDDTGTTDGFLSLTVTLDKSESINMIPDGLYRWGVQGVYGEIEYELGGYVRPRFNAVV